MNFLSSLFSAIGSVFTWVTGRSTLKNAADVKVAAKAQAEVNAADKTAKAIAAKDVNEIRRELSE